VGCCRVGSLLTFDIPQTALVATLDTCDFIIIFLICSFDRENANEKLYQTIFFTTSLIIPLLTITWLYLNMLLRLWRGSAATHGPGPMRDKNACKGKENKVRVTRMIVVVIIVFAVCWLPLQLVLLLKAYGYYTTDSGSALVIFQIVANCLAYCNSCLNPILYAFFSPNYRKAFMNAVSCGSNPNLNLLGNGNLGNNTANATGGNACTSNRDPTDQSRVNRETRKTVVFASGTDAEFELQPLINTLGQQVSFK
jgi:hypothetical protein